MIIGYQIEVQNDHIKENLCEKIVTEIPPYKGDLLVRKLRDSIIINWNGLYKHSPDEGEKFRVDWIDSVGYKRQVVAKKIDKSFKCDWDIVANVDAEDERFRLF